MNQERKGNFLRCYSFWPAPAFWDNWPLLWHRYGCNHSVFAYRSRCYMDGRYEQNSRHSGSDMNSFQYKNV